MNKLAIIFLIFFLSYFIVSAEPVNSSTDLNLSIDLYSPDIWYFGSINDLKIYTYNKYEAINVDNLTFIFYNNSDITINQLDFQRIGTGYYIQKFSVDSIVDIDQKNITVKITINKDNQNFTKDINILVHKSSMIIKLYLNIEKITDKLVDDFRDRSIREHNYVLYIILSIIICLVILMITIIHYNNRVLNIAAKPK